MSVSKRGLHAFFDALKQYGIVMKWDGEPIGEYYVGENHVGSFTYNLQTYSVNTTPEFNPGNQRVYTTLQVKHNGRNFVESFNFDEQTKDFQRTLFKKLGITSNPEMDRTVDITSNPGIERAVEISAEEFVEKCFKYFQNQTKVIQAQPLHNGKRAIGPRVKYVFRLIQLSPQIDNDDLKLIYSVQYRRNVLMGSVIGEFREFAKLKLITKTDNLHEKNYTLYTQNLNGNSQQILFGTQQPTSLDQWKHAVKTSLGQIMQSVADQLYLQTLSTGCPTCSEHQKCPECEQWDALERLVAAVELHMDDLAMGSKVSKSWEMGVGPSPIS